MGSSVDTENRRLTRHTTAGDTEWGTPLRGSRALRTPGQPREPHRRLSHRRMNRTISEIEIALLRSSLALWSIEF
jgi:hypothetical protein